MPALALILAGAGGVHAQNSVPADSARTTLHGVYTEAQARRGEDAYRRFCAECHAPAVHSSRAFRQAWDGLPAFQLYELIRTTMPNDNPGRLSRNQYADIVAYLFRLNGMPPGTRALPADEAGLRQIRIASPPSP
jgi:mono/diheme cytochrome c family protein